ncbi:sensor histidine kinase [Limnoglobus roseus]|uniref:histidine kinase n=1 Tax=Limnoglobus roseus TaxID=2598579 RepID=A0A5C1APL4_9BACT|nr:sensor histidine kinase [Limnoglobus roseus]QEL20073.1 PAS domain S-box protein [Limnoglobus roseus]
MDRKLGRGVLVGFCVIFLTLILFAIVTYRNITRLAESESWVAHTHEVLDVLEATLSTLKDAQNGYRGYHATGNTAFAKPYHEAKATLPLHLSTFEQLASDNPAQQQRVSEFRRAAESVLDLYGRGIQIRQDQGFDASERFILQGTGNAEMERARSLIGEMKAEEQRLLTIRTRESRTQYNTAVVTMILSVLFGLFLTAIAFGLTMRDRHQREQTAMMLQAARDALEQRVKDRTAELQAEVLERQRAEIELQNSTKRLEESNRELEQFATVASHDLQEPLRKIQAFSDRLSEVSGPVLQGAGQDYLARIVSSAGRMRTLIDDLLSFSRVTRKGQPFVPTNLARIAEEVVSDLEGRLRETGGRVDVVEPLPTIAADPLQIRQLLQNLIANGLKFRKPRESPVVTVRAELLPEVEGIPGPACRLTVADNGVGFEQEYAERIFQMFQRLHGRSLYEGNGIGLAICRKIVERHHGTITAIGETDVGSTFVVTLPVDQTTLE